MPISRAAKSKGMLAGAGLAMLGVYVIVAEKDATGGMAIVMVGLGILGIRDAQ